LSQTKTLKTVTKLPEIGTQGPGSKKTHPGSGSATLMVRSWTEKRRIETERYLLLFMFSEDEESLLVSDRSEYGTPRTTATESTVNTPNSALRWVRVTQPLTKNVVHIATGKPFPKIYLRLPELPKIGSNCFPVNYVVMNTYR
jgi:hypothetical protein